MRVIVKNCAVLGLIAALTACAADKDRYPSLGLRPFESGTAPVVAQPPAAPIRPPISAAALGALRAKASAAQAAFASQAAATAPLARAAAGQSVESNTRAAAMVAMAELSSQRSATSAVLADLEELETQAAGALAPDPALAAARAEVAALLANQDAAIAQLWAALGQ